MKARAEIEARLRAVVGEDSAIEARELLASTDDERELERRINRRISGEPLQYILGEWDFYGMNFKLSPAVLIPRPDTEILVETAIGLIRERGYKSVLDLCTGSGCIGIAIGGHTRATIALSDISGSALEVAKLNAQRHGLTAELIRSDLFENIEASFDCIVCNPPYLSEADMGSLQRELLHEPREALFGGADGLDFYRRIARCYLSHLNRGGSLLLEIGSMQGESVKRIFNGGVLVRDYGGRDRVLIVEDNRC